MLKQTAVYSLIDESWLPVRRRSGRSEWITPWQITDDLANDPIVALEPPRADFKGALTEFLIGLLTTCAAPADDDEWEERWEVPPGPNALRADLSRFAGAFILDGDGPRFFQDLEELPAKPTLAAGLLIDAPGENTLKRNTDLFVKRAQVGALGPAAAAMALFTLQTYAPSGGSGHRTSLRGGGPLTTLVSAGETLWHVVWGNVETQAIINARGASFFEGGGTDSPESIFPWLSATRTSGKGGRLTTPADVHPFQVYWGMPRRIRLDFSVGEPGICDLTGLDVHRLVRSYRTVKHGVEYSEGFQHPLSPHYRDTKSQVYLPVHGQPGGVSYRHWLGVVVEDAGGARRPAQCVRHFRERRAEIVEGGIRLAVFGYDMDNMKTRAWFESEMPVPAISGDAARRRFEDTTRQLIKGAAEVATGVVSAVKRALFNDPKGAPGDFSFVTERFWHETEAAFHERLHELMKTLEDEREDATRPVRARWLEELRLAALAIFDSEVQTLGLEEGAMARIVGARFDLVQRLNGGRGARKIFDGLGLPLPERARRGKRKEKA